MRFFEKISKETYIKEFGSEVNYDKIEIPTRSTKHSAAYDIRSMDEVTIKPGCDSVIRTGLKVCMNDEEVFYIYSRSSLGYKYNVSLVNSVGVIDSDYYNNIDNEGHFKVKLINNGKKDFNIKIGDRIAQGVFMKYLVTDDEKEITATRMGGIGSTDRREI